MERALSSGFSRVKIKHTPKAFPAMNWLIGRTVRGKWLQQSIPYTLKIRLDAIIPTYSLSARPGFFSSLLAAEPRTKHTMHEDDRRLYYPTINSHISRQRQRLMQPLEVRYRGPGTAM